MNKLGVIILSMGLALVVVGFSVIMVCLYNSPF